MCRQHLTNAARLPQRLLRAGLEGLRAALRVETRRDSLVVYPRAADGLMEEVLGLIRAKPACRVAGVKVLEGRLDDVFRELTMPARKAS